MTQLSFVIGKLQIPAERSLLPVESLHEASDLPPKYFKVGAKVCLPQYPVEMVRALIFVWLSAGLRLGEIRRLRAGCIRWNSKVHKIEEIPENSQDAICLLEAPTNKTSGAFTKSVDRLVGEAIEKWEKVRPKQPPALDQKYYDPRQAQRLARLRGRCVASRQFSAD